MYSLLANCLPYYTLVTCAFNVASFLAVLVSMTSSTSSPGNMSPLGTNSDEAHYMVIHKVSYWLPRGALHSSTIGSAWGSGSYVLVC